MLPRSYAPPRPPWAVRPPAGPGLDSEPPDWRSSVPAFDDVVAVFLEELFALQPDVATAVGDHRHDGRWPDMSEAGHAARVAFIDRWEATLAGIDAGSMTADERIDLDLVRGELASFRFAETELREETVEPAVLGLPRRRRAAPAARPRLRATRHAARVRPGPARGDPAPAGPGADGHRDPPHAPGLEAPRRCCRQAHRRRGDAGEGRGRRARRPPRRPTPRWPPSCPASAPPRTRPPGRSMGWPRTSPRRSSRT